MVISDDEASLLRAHDVVRVALRRDACDLLEKPFDSEMLLELVARLVRVARSEP